MAQTAPDRRSRPAGAPRWVRGLGVLLGFLGALLALWWFNGVQQIAGVWGIGVGPILRDGARFLPGGTGAQLASYLALAAGPVVVFLLWLVLVRQSLGPRGPRPLHFVVPLVALGLYVGGATLILRHTGATHVSSLEAVSGRTGITFPEGCTLVDARGLLGKGPVTMLIARLEAPETAADELLRFPGKCWPAGAKAVPEKVDFQYSTMHAFDPESETMIWFTGGARRQYAGRTVTRAEGRNSATARVVVGRRQGAPSLICLSYIVTPPRATTAQGK